MKGEDKIIAQTLQNATNISTDSLMQIWRQLDQSRTFTETHSVEEKFYETPVDYPVSKTETVPDQKLTFYKNYVKNVLPDNFDVDVNEDSLIIKYKNNQ